MAEPVSELEEAEDKRKEFVLSERKIQLTSDESACLD
jgi:hypothetical protein